MENLEDKVKEEKMNLLMLILYSILIRLIKEISEYIKETKKGLKQMKSQL